ncbi:MAG: isocitrate/isopropylmalate dehydrogenase family protein [Planctomycetales bacterium]|nr:isocitrate/isopropylmalate dehydrogenase family protein [Planctomycetales bacterium]
MTPHDSRLRSFLIAVLPGDGIGRDVVSSTLEVLATVAERLDGVTFETEEHSVGAAEFQRSGDPLPEAAVVACRRADAVLLGAMGLPNVRWPNGKEITPQIDLRERLDLYAGIRPIFLYHEQDSPLKGYGAGEIDFLIVRENCEGLFSARGSPFDLQSEEVTDVLRITRQGAERICRTAFELAKQRRNHVTLVDKANVLPSMVYFRSVFDDVASHYPDIETDRVYIDAMALYLVQRPHAFDVIVTENMFGDILSDLAAGLVGGMGMAPSADVGPNCAVFQPSHGTAPDIAGKGIANPIATILSLAMLLEHLQDSEATRGGQLIREAVAQVLACPQHRTPDMGGFLSTREITDLILDAINQR